MFRFARPAVVHGTRSAASMMSAALPRAALAPMTTQTTRIAPRVVSVARSYSVISSSPQAELYDYDKVKKLATNPQPNTQLVDVREPLEFLEGHIPGAINVPFKLSPGALGLSPEEFHDAFGFDKPNPKDLLVFYCLGGVRSTSAAELAETFGYKHRGNYVGSWEDWVTHENKAKA